MGSAYVAAQGCTRLTHPVHSRRLSAWSIMNDAALEDDQSGTSRRTGSGTITIARIRRLFAVTSAMAVVSGGFGTAPAAAERVPLPDVTQFSDTVDGWRFSLTISELRVDAVPNLATSAFTKEGFVSANATATVDGVGDVSVNSGFIVLGVQLGCQVDVSEGLELGIDPEVDLLNLDLDEETSLLEDPVFDFWPGIDTKLRAGNISVLGLGAKSMKSRTATITVRDAHVEVSECAGPVTVRVFASAKISTDTSDDSLNAYGLAFPL